MSLIIVNPTEPPKRRGKQKRSQTMAKRRSAAQMAATRRLVAYNKGKRHANPTRRKYKVRRHANPSQALRVRRRSASDSGGGFFKELMSKDGMFMIAAVMGTGPVVNFAVNKIMPSASGMTRTAVKTGVGLGLAWAVYKYANKKAGVLVGLVSVGNAIMDVIDATMTQERPKIAVGADGKPALAGYTKSQTHLFGYAKPKTLSGADAGSAHMPRRPKEPGVRRL